MSQRLVFCLAVAVSVTVFTTVTGGWLPQSSAMVVVFLVATIVAVITWPESS
jgi:hypothetical protein